MLLELDLLYPYGQNPPSFFQLGKHNAMLLSLYRIHDCAVRKIPSQLLDVANSYA